MKFRTQLTRARKQKGLSQEELAERLDVSRQTIYKWEAGITYPDIDKLYRLAAALDVSPAYLLGEADGCPDPSLNEVPTAPQNEQADTVSKQGTLRHYKRFARMIGACTLLILASVGLLVLLNGFDFRGAAAIGVIQLLCCIFVAVIGYVMAGLRHEPFEKERSALPLFEEWEKQKMQRSFAGKIVAGLVLIFAGLVFVVCAGFLDIERLSYIAVAAFLALIGVAVYLFITAGILYDLYMGEESPRGHHEKKNEPQEAICGVIMILATAVFLLLGFVWGLWHPGWVAFPIGGLLCGCVSTVFGALGKKK